MNKKFFMILLLFVGIKVTYANDINIHLIHLGNQKIFIQNITNQAIQESYPYWKNKIKKLDINIELNPQKATDSLSNLNSKYCKIQINYQNLKPIILSNINDDLTFMIWHELSHCMLGRNILLKKYHWLTIHNSNEIKELNEKINQRTNLSIKNISCLQCENKDFKIAPPLVAYHEMFADTQASMWWIQQHKSINEIKLLYLKRAKYYNKNPQGETHISNFDIPIILKNKKSISEMSVKKIFENAKKITEKGFIQYLKNI